MFKLPTDSENLLVQIELYCVSRLGFSEGEVLIRNEFAILWLRLPGSGSQPIGVITVFWLNIFFKFKLPFESLKSLVGQLTFPEFSNVNILLFFGKVLF